MPTIRPQAVFDDKYESQTKYTIDLDLPEAGLLSSFFLGVKAKPDTSTEGSSPFMKHLISSVNVNQGGQAQLCGAPPEAFAADYYYKTGMMPQMGKQIAEDASETVEEIIPILFGRHINDVEHYIDLSKLTDPKVSVTYDLAGTDPFGYTEWDNSYYPRFTGVANFLGGAGIVPSKGFHSLRTIEKYTPVDSETRNVELKQGQPIRRLYMQFDRTDVAYGMVHSVSNVRIHGKNKQWIPFDLNIKEFQQVIRRQFGYCMAKAYIQYAFYGKNMDGIVDLKEDYEFTQSESETSFPVIVGGAGRQAPIRQFKEDVYTADEASVSAHFCAVGLAPWSIYPVDMPNMLGREYLDPTEEAVKPVYLEITHVSNAATIGGPFKVHLLDLQPNP